jgi:large subunit ribosomal protein L22
MRLVADLVRGQKVERALNILRFSSKEASRKLEKLVLSVLPTGKQKNPEANMEEAGLFVKTITVDGGMMLKRLVQLRSCTQNKKTNHVTIVLGSINNTHKQFNTRWDKRQIQLEIDLVSSEDGTQTGMVDDYDKLAEDHKIRKYIHARLSKKLVYQKVIIETSWKLVTVTITQC